MAGWTPTLTGHATSPPGPGWALVKPQRLEKPMPSSIGTFTSGSLLVEHGPLAGAVAPQRAVRAGRVRPGEDPVLPRGEAGEDLGFHGLRAGEAQVGLHPGQRVRAERGAFLQRDP